MELDKIVKMWRMSATFANSCRGSSNQRVVGKENPCRDKARSEALVMLIRTVGRRAARERLDLSDVRNLHLSLKGNIRQHVAVLSLRRFQETRRLDFLSS